MLSLLATENIYKFIKTQKRILFRLNIYDISMIYEYNDFHLYLKIWKLNLLKKFILFKYASLEHLRDMEAIFISGRISLGAT